MANPKIVDDDMALLSGDYWNGIEVVGKPIVVTFSFPESASWLAQLAAK
jgi:hypothetical protein